MISECTDIKTTTSDMRTSQGNKYQENKYPGHIIRHINILKTALEEEVEGKKSKSGQM